MSVAAPGLFAAAAAAASTHAARVLPYIHTDIAPFGGTKHVLKA
jgi:hypothetical protein